VSHRQIHKITVSHRQKHDEQCFPDQATNEECRTDKHPILANPLTDQAKHANQLTRATDRAEARPTKPMEFARNAPNRADARPIDPTRPRPMRQPFFCLLGHFAAISDILLQCTQAFW
jgi:hypothetical protein